MSIATQNRVIFSRAWEMPNSRTYNIKCIQKLIGRYNDKAKFSIDPFANESRLATITNDLNPDYNCDYSLDAIDFIEQFEINSVDVVLFDPPYSSRQVSECYKSLGMTVNMETTQSSFWSKIKRSIASVVKPSGYVISFGWNSNGVGQKLGFEIVEILLVAHGGAHNDTIVTVERKTKEYLFR